MPGQRLGLGRTDDLEDLLPHQLLAVQQGIAQGLEDVAVGPDERLGHRLGVVEEPVDRGATDLVGQHLGHGVGTAADGRRLPAHQGPPHPQCADHGSGGVGGGGEVPRRSRTGLAEVGLLGHHPAHGDLDAGHDLRAGPGEALLEVGVGQHPESVLALDDRQHLELAVLAHQVGHGGVPGLVGGDAPALLVGVLHRLAQADLLGDLGLLDVVPVQRRRPPAQGPHQGLVEEVLDHHRRVAGGHGGQAVEPDRVVEVGHVRLLGQVVVDDLPPVGSAGKAEVDAAVEAAGAQEGGVEVGRPVGGPHDEHVGREQAGLAQGAGRGQEAVDQVGAPPPQPGRPGRLVEALELDEQLVDHAGHAVALAPAAHAGPSPADGVDLLDEADGPALLAGRAAQGPEVAADLSVGLAVVHRLEGRRRHEEEGDTGLGGHGLGHVGLARARRPLEEDGPPGRAPHALPEGLVGQEQVEGAHHLVLDDAGALDVVEADVDLARPVEHVGRAPRTEHGSDDRQADDRHQGEDREHLDQPGRQRRQRPLTRERRHPEPGRGQRDCRGQPPQPPAPGPLASRGHVGQGAAQHLSLTEAHEVAHATRSVVDGYEERP